MKTIMIPALDLAIRRQAMKIPIAKGKSLLPLRETLADIEKSYITQALAQTQGNVSRTARLLCIQRTTLIEKINKYELRASD